MSDMKTYKDHPYSELFPLGDLTGPEWNAFRASVCDAQRDAIYLYDGKILDGRRRYRACMEGDVEPRVTVFVGTDHDALEFSIAKNLHRRHLSESQKGMVGVAIKKALEEAAARRMKEGQQLGGKTAGRSRAKDSSPLNLTESKEGRDARDEAAKIVGVSPTMITFAERVTDKGIPELQKKVISGEVSVSAAAEVAKLPEQEQEEILSDGPDAVKEHAANVRRAKTTPLDSLRKAWSKASAEERDTFLKEVQHAS